MSLNPNEGYSLLSRANSLARKKNYNDALAMYEKALTFNPALCEAWLGYGNVYAELNCLHDAFDAFTKALALKSDLPEALLGLANVLAKLKAYDSALATYHHLLKIKYDRPEVWLGLANIFYALARYQDAMAAYVKASQSGNFPLYVQGALFDSKMHICGWDDFYHEQSRLIAAVNDGNPIADPFVFFNIS